MSNYRFVLYALLAEQGSIFVLFLNEGFWYRFALFLSLHLIASICFAVVLPILLPTRFDGKLRAGLLFFAFTFFIPFFGPMGMILALVYFRFVMKKKWKATFYSIPLLPFADIYKKKRSTMGEGAAWSRLQTSTLPRSVRLQALMAACGVPGQNASRLLQMATCDGDDEVRLLAFNYYEKHEKELNDSINQLLAQLKDTNDDRVKGAICGRLAFAYWEFVYHEIARGELKEFYLQQALHYVGLAEELAGENHLVTILKARMYLHRGEITDAERAITRALRLGASPDKIIPFQAEAMYMKGDFETLKNLFQAHPSLRQKPGIGAVAAFWTEV